MPPKTKAALTRKRTMAQRSTLNAAPPKAPSATAAKPDEPMKPVVEKLTTSVRTTKTASGEDRFVCNWTGLPIAVRFGIPQGGQKKKMAGAFLDWGCVVAFLKAQLSRNQLTPAQYTSRLRAIVRVGKFTPEQMPMPVAPMPEILEGSLGKEITVSEFQQLYMRPEHLQMSAGSETIADYLAAQAAKKEERQAKKLEKENAEKGEDAEPPAKKAKKVRPPSYQIRVLDAAKDREVVLNDPEQETTLDELFLILKEEYDLAQIPEGRNFRVAFMNDSLYIAPMVQGGTQGVRNQRAQTLLAKRGPLFSVIMGNVLEVTKTST